MTAVLSIDEIKFLLESLNYTKLKFQNYQDYPSYEFQQERIAKVDDLITKLREMKKEMQK